MWLFPSIAYGCGQINVQGTNIKKTEKLNSELKKSNLSTESQ